LIRVADPLRMYAFVCDKAGKQNMMAIKKQLQLSGDLIVGGRQKIPLQIRVEIRNF
jgi:hypothetical protein